MAEQKKSCFIIMPITTPQELIGEYNNDIDHFTHVLDQLFIPSIEKAGLEPIPPIVQGADIVQAEIINNLEKCDVVLCDMSTLNSNVFLGK